MSLQVRRAAFSRQAASAGPGRSQGTRARTIVFGRATQDAFFIFF